MSNPIIKEGWMTKQGGGFKSWKKRWFVFNGIDLTYSKKKGKESLGSVDMSKVMRVEEAPELQKPGGFKIITAKRTFRFISENANERKSWISFLTANLNSNLSRSYTALVPMEKNSLRNLPLTPIQQDGPPSVSDYSIISILSYGASTIHYLCRKKMQIAEFFVMKQYSKFTLSPYSETILNKMEETFIGNIFSFVCPIADVFSTNDFVFIINKFTTGGNLLGNFQSEKVMNKLKSQGDTYIDEGVVKRYVSEILIGLDILHRNHFYYLDFHMSNILLSPEGIVQLSPVGLFPANFQAKHSKSISPFLDDFKNPSTS